MSITETSKNNEEKGPIVRMRISERLLGACIGSLVGRRLVFVKTRYCVFSTTTLCLTIR